MESTQIRAHRRLLNAVIFLTGASQNGIMKEIRETSQELYTATVESRRILCPAEGADAQHNIVTFLLQLPPLFSGTGFVTA